MADTTMLNRDGEWVPAIPEPLSFMWRHSCAAIACNKTFWTREGYRAHYALAHILKLDSP